MVFATSKLVRRNTQQLQEEASKKVGQIDANDPTILGQVTRGECQMLNRVLLASTAMAGNLDAVPHACTNAAEGDAPNTHRASWM